MAALDTRMDITDADDTAVDNGSARVRKPPAMQRRKPTPLQTAKWNAVQKAKRKGLSIRGIARELGIHRSTAKKYMEAASPPVKRSMVRTEWSCNIRLSTGDIYAGHLGGHLS